MKQKAISRDLHDYVSPTTQAVVDGSLTKDIDNNIEICVALDRKDGPGCQYSPLYWVERMYQAVAAKLFPSFEEAYKAILIQAKAKGLSDKQEAELESWLGSLGFGVASKEVKPVENPGYSSIDFKQKQVAAGFKVAGKALANLRGKANEQSAFKHLGCILAAYMPQRESLKAKLRIGQLLSLGFSVPEVRYACKKESISSKYLTQFLA